jgi:hypothetical protein
MNKFSSKKSVKQTLYKSFKSITVHGVANLVNSNKPITKAIWFICILVSASLCGYLVVESILVYLNYEVVTSVRVLNERMSEFPAVMLCNKNNLNEKLIEDLSRNSILNTTKLDLLFANLTVHQSQVKSELLKTKIYAYLMNKNESEKKKASFSLDEMLINCKHEFEKCDPNEFNWFFHSLYGNCYVIYSGRDANNNVLDKKMTKRPSRYNSLQLELFIGPPNKLEFLSSSSGFQLFIFNQSDNFNKLDFTDLSPGHEFNVVIHRTFLQQMPKPYSSCELQPEKIGKFKSPFIQVFKKFNMTYRQTDCVDYCYQYYSLQICNCTDYILDPRLNDKMCFTDEEFNCVFDFYYFVFSQGDFLPKYCYPFCPLECESIKISTSISSSRYPTNEYFELIKQDPQLKNTLFKHSNWSYVKQSILKVNIYYETLSYTLISENAAMSVVRLLANIGKF